MAQSVLDAERCRSMVVHVVRVERITVAMTRTQAGFGDGERQLTDGRDNDKHDRPVLPVSKERERKIINVFPASVPLLRVLRRGGCGGRRRR